MKSCGPVTIRATTPRFGIGDSVPVVGNLDSLETVQVIVDQGHVDTRGVRIDRVPNQLGESKNGLPDLRNALQMIIVNLYLKGLGCHAAHLAERTSACCRTVCTAAS